MEQLIGSNPRVGYVNLFVAEDFFQRANNSVVDAQWA